ncbi:MAG: hypothetical protein M1825_003789 [Sarcosagium campestre]|nr:MAG: hypothetical protein M1825_003789 [Sarcosagium campestre]
MFILPPGSNTSADFLRISRSSIDDIISQNLNALITPARVGFDPNSTSAPSPRRPYRSRVDPSSCKSFKDDILFPSWQSRSDVLGYCTSVATSPDPDDPDLASREVESARDQERVVDERLDPYSGRFFPRETRTEILAGIIRDERGVENIIRDRSWSVISERCGDRDSGERWEDALNDWRDRRSRRG